MAKKKTVTHYRAKCIGCGSCAMLASKYWQMNDQDGQADLLDSELVAENIYKRSVDVEDENLVKEVAAACPAEVIKFD